MLLHPGLIDNAVRLGTSHYAAIIGTRPSAGARSPTLWNAAFKKAGVDGQMHPFDVAVERLKPLITALKTDARFIGGACGTPHKMALLPLLDDVEPEARKIGAVNCIYRDGDSLIGANTDGAGALPALAALAGDLAGKNITIIGLGGAGRAVAVYAAGAARSVTLVNRNAAVAREVANLLPNAEVGNFPLTPAELSQSDILINCTSLGSSVFPGLSALSSSMSPATNLTESRQAIAFLPARAVVFDIVYQPSETPLLTMAKLTGLRTLNGEAMNLEQAVLAFDRAMPQALSSAEIRAVMRQAVS